MDNRLLTIPSVVDRRAAELADHPALITEDRVLTFAELRGEVRRAAGVLMSLGVRAGDRVAIWAPNSWHWVVACLGAQYAGASVVPLNVNSTAAEAGDVLARSGARVLFATDSFPGGDPELAHVVRIPDGVGDREWSDFLDGPGAAPAEIDARAAAVSPEDVADIVFTSGTTGRSKGVVCAHRQSLSAPASASECRGMTPDDRYLCLSPFFHVFGYKGGMLSCLVSGAALVARRVFDPDQIMVMVAEQGVTILPGPPTLFMALLDHPARANYDLSSLRFASIGGATVPLALIERISRDLGIPSRTGYGLTEASGFGTASWPDDDPATVATTCGRPIAGFELRIDDPDESGVGEILLRGPNVMLGYLDDPEATAAVIDADGWLHTGDVGSVDAGGHLRITDRVKDMYICGGVNVYPAEVEQVLVRLAGVAAVAVVGVPDEYRGEVGRAFVVRRPGAQLDERTVMEFAREHLAHVKTPRSVVFVEELPRNAAGKVLKTALREFTCTPDRLRPRGLGGPPMGLVENWVADAWQALLNIERPGRRDEFVDLGGDSVAAAEFSGLLETQFGVSMSLDRLAECPTIAAVVADLQTGEGRRRQPVVTLRADADGPLCLMVPGIGGHAWQFVPLAKAVGVPCEMRGLSLMDLGGDQAAGDLRARVRAAALDAVGDGAAAGRAVVVAGYSFGGMIAADLACWLGENGVPVAKLVLLDPDPLDSGVPSWNPNHIQRGPRVVMFTPGSPAARQLNSEIVAMSELLQAAYLDGSVRLPPASATSVAWLQTREVAAKYEGFPDLFGTPVGRLTRTTIDVDHLGLIEIPGADQVARWLDRELAG